MHQIASSAEEKGAGLENVPKELSECIKTNIKVNFFQEDKIKVAKFLGSYLKLY